MDGLVNSDLPADEVEGSGTELGSGAEARDEAGDKAGVGSGGQTEVGATAETDAESPKPAEETQTQGGNASSAGSGEEKAGAAAKPDADADADTGTNTEPSEEAEVRTTGPRIYVACLKAYNSGRLHGRWIDVCDGVDAIWEGIHAMLKASPCRGAEEHAIHDYDGFEGAEIHEYDSPETIAALAEFIEEHGRVGAELLIHYGRDLEDARAAFENAAGEWQSLADFAEELITDTTEIPENVARYVDYEAIARDMELNGDIFTVRLGFDEIHVFWTR